MPEGRGDDDMKKTTISVQELASELGISMTKAYELAKREDFPVIRIGKRILIPVEILNEWLRREADNGNRE